VALAELYHLIEKPRSSAGRGFFHQTEREVQKNAVVVLPTTYRLEGPVRGRAGRNAGTLQSEGFPETRQ